MIDSLFVWLTQAIEQNHLLGLGAAFIWGILSILLSPCHLSSIPLIVGYISQQSGLSAKRAFRISFAFALGILVSIGLIGVVTSLLGRMLGDIGQWGNYLVAVIFVLAGLYLMGILKLNLSGVSQAKTYGHGIAAGFVLGLLFGIALGPCTFAFMAPILVIVLARSVGSFFYGIPLLLMYGIGHCSVIVLAGTFTRMIESYLHWNEQSKALDWLKKICGFLLLVSALYLLWR